MAIGDRATPVVLIPGHAQTVWGRAAVANFVLGGLGAGLYIAAALESGLRPSTVAAVASWLGPALVIGGLAAAATEAGRPLRGARVLRRPGTSWMSRELWLGLGFAGLAAGEWVGPSQLLRALATLAALGLVVTQGCMVQRARGVAAWNVDVMPVVFVSSALVSGGGLLVLVAVSGGRGPGAATLGAALWLLVTGAVVWLAYLTWSRDDAFLGATGPLREDRMAIAIIGGGHVVPFVLAGLALALPDLALAAAALGGVLTIGGQIYAKAALILTAGRLRPITLPRLRLDGRSP